MPSVQQQLLAISSKGVDACPDAGKASVVREVPCPPARGIAQSTKTVFVVLLCVALLCILALAVAVGWFLTGYGIWLLSRQTPPH